MSGKPVLLHYYLTNRCNARCSFCDIWQESSKVDAKLPDVLSNLAQARALGCRFVDFTGGEPLLHPDLPAMLREAKKRGFTTSVTTNCLLFEKRAPELAGLIDLLHFSLDADTAEVHDALRGVKSFDAVLRSIPAALENNLVPDLLYTYTNETIGAFEGVYRLARKHRLILILDPVFEVSGAMDSVSAQTHERARRYARRPGVYLNTAHLALRKAGGNNTDHPLCRAVSSTLVVLPGNSLALPCYHHRQSALAIDGDLKAAAQSPMRREACRREGAYPFCAGCHINCYFDPSFTFGRPTIFSVLSIVAKFRYAFRKYLIYRRTPIF